MSVHSTSQINSTRLPYHFSSTQDRLSHIMPSWEALISSIKSHRKSPRVLEIGSGEGRSAVHLISQLCNPTGSIVCIDHFDLLDTVGGRERYANIHHNLNVAGSSNYRSMAQSSLPALMMLLEEEIGTKGPGYDWIYIGGSGGMDDTFLVGELSWRLARKDAIIIFDDCCWGSNDIQNRSRGIEGFLNLHEGEYERVVEVGSEQHLVVLRKTVDIRICFLKVPEKYSRSQPKDTKLQQPSTARFPHLFPYSFSFYFRFMGFFALLLLFAFTFGRGSMGSNGVWRILGFNRPQNNLQSSWKVVDEGNDGINLTLTVDSTYAMSAAVTIYSAVDRTPGLISIFVVDCGLNEEEKASLRQSLPRTNDVTISFLPLPQNSTANELGSATWTKLDLDAILPIERVLYLDADTFIRGDLTPLWEYNLGDRAIGAVAHVGHPMGHDPNEKHPYFNAGVLLMNLTKIRESSEALRKKGREMRGARFRDEDVLNIHFKDWVHLSARWNAQGLGTYAINSSPERSEKEMKEMEDPAIVHFTGPVNPSLVDVLNPYVQPPNAKPWGYIGAPGHPFSGEWWKSLEKTPYRGYGTSAERSKEIEDQLEKVIDVTSKKFREKVAAFRRADDNFLSNILVKNY